MTRQELIDLGEKIVSVDGTEQEINTLMELFDQHIPYPNGSSLFFHPENYDGRDHEIINYNPTVEEVVDRCLAYKVIQL